MAHDAMIKKLEGQGLLRKPGGLTGEEEAKRTQAKMEQVGFDIYHDSPTAREINDLQLRFIDLYKESKIGIREFGAAFADAVLMIGYAAGEDDGLATAAAGK
jgi:hypothetical protein